MLDQRTAFMPRSLKPLNEPFGSVAQVSTDLLCSSLDELSRMRPGTQDRRWSAIVSVKRSKRLDHLDVLIGSFGKASGIHFEKTSIPIRRKPARLRLIRLDRGDAWLIVWFILFNVDMASSHRKHWLVRNKSNSSTSTASQRATAFRLFFKSI